MVQIAVGKIISDPMPLEWRDERTFKSANGVWQLIFHDAVEFHMGSYGWKAKLIKEGKDASANHLIIKSGGFRSPLKYQPWCQNEPVLALHLWKWWDSKIYLYNVDDQRLVERKLVGSPSEIQWSPIGEQLAVTYEGQVELLRNNVEKVTSISIRHQKSEWPEVFWWRDGQRLFVICRESRATKTKLSFFDSRDGNLLSSADFDPIDLLPYDEAAYSKIYRNRFSLQIGPGVKGAGDLLDKWSSLEFDIERCLLRGTVCRPVGPCEQKDETYTCAAKEVGIEVTISA